MVGFVARLDASTEADLVFCANSVISQNAYQGCDLELLGAAEASRGFLA